MDSSNIVQTREKFRANKKVKSLRNWIVQLCGKQIYVEGISEEDGELWHSSKVVSSKGSNYVTTATGSDYILLGEIDVARAMNEGVPDQFIQSFCNGFPSNWKAVLKSVAATKSRQETSVKSQQIARKDIHHKKTDSKDPVPTADVDASHIEHCHYMSSVTANNENVAQINGDNAGSDSSSIVDSSKVNGEFTVLPTLQILPSNSVENTAAAVDTVGNGRLGSGHAETPVTYLLGRSIGSELVAVSRAADASCLCSVEDNFATIVNANIPQTTSDGYPVSSLLTHGHRELADDVSKGETKCIRGLSEAAMTTAKIPVEEPAIASGNTVVNALQHPDDDKQCNSEIAAGATKAVSKIIGDVVRRSNRQRINPLRFWANERQIYSPRNVSTVIQSGTPDALINHHKAFQKLSYRRCLRQRKSKQSDSKVVSKQPKTSELSNNKRQRGDEKSTQREQKKQKTIDRQNVSNKGGGIGVNVKVLGNGNKDSCVDGNVVADSAASSTAVPNRFIEAAGNCPETERAAWNVARPPLSRRVENLRRQVTSLNAAKVNESKKPDKVQQTPVELDVLLLTPVSSCNRESRQRLTFDCVSPLVVANNKPSRLHVYSSPDYTDVEADVIGRSFLGSHSKAEKQRLELHKKAFSSGSVDCESTENECSVVGKNRSERLKKSNVDSCKPVEQLMIRPTRKKQKISVPYKPAAEKCSKRGNKQQLFDHPSTAVSKRKGFASCVPFQLTNVLCRSPRVCLTPVTNWREITSRNSAIIDSERVERQASEESVDIDFLSQSFCHVCPIPARKRISPLKQKKVKSQRKAQTPAVAQVTRKNCKKEGLHSKQVELPQVEQVKTRGPCSKLGVASSNHSKMLDDHSMTRRPARTTRSDMKKDSNVDGKDNKSRCQEDSEASVSKAKKDNKNRCQKDSEASAVKGKHQAGRSAPANRSEKKTAKPKVAKVQKSKIKQQNGSKSSSVRPKSARKMPVNNDSGNIPQKSPWETAGVLPAKLPEDSSVVEKSTDQIRTSDKVDVSQAAVKQLKNKRVMKAIDVNVADQRRKPKNETAARLKKGADKKRAVSTAVVQAECMPADHQPASGIEKSEELVVQDKPNKLSVKLAGRGTLKRKRQLAALIEEHEKGRKSDDFADMFSSTPYTRPQHLAVKNLMDGTDLLNFPSVLDISLGGRSCMTPHGLYQQCGTPDSMSATALGTPSFLPSFSVDSKDVELYIHRFQKNRQRKNIVQAETALGKPSTSSATPSKTKFLQHKTTSRNVAAAGGQLFALHSLPNQNDIDSADEMDVYFDDEF